MQIVIDIDDNLYARLFDNGIDNHDDAEDMAKAIRKGTPLPKGHGRLLDVDKVKENHERWIGYLDEDMITRLNIAVDKHIPTVIEADREDEDEPCSECKHHDIEDAQSGYCDSCYAGEYFKPKGGSE